MRGARDKRRPPRGPLGGEAGLTIVEVLVAALILVIAVLAIFQILDAATRSTFRAEESQVAINRAQAELEEIRNLDYGEVALTAPPSTSTDSNDPRSRVSGTQFDVNRDGNLADLVINGGSLSQGGQVSGGLVDPGPEPFQSGDVSGQIHRFVVWRNDPNCNVLVCPGLQDLKRVIVAIKLGEAAISFERPYIEVQSDFTDPDVSAVTGTPPPQGSEVVEQQFWLMDTTCDKQSRQAIVPDPGTDGHRLHNTLGTCSQGLRTGTTAGAPDALMTSQPPDPTPNNPDDPPLYDYATDVEPATGDPASDKGLQLVKQDGAGCDSTGGPVDPHQKIHRWVSAPLPFGFVIEERTTLEIFTRTLNGARHPGGICVYPFTREDRDGVVATDTPIVISRVSATSSPFGSWGCALAGPAVSCQNEDWPAPDRWGRLQVRMELPRTVVPVGRRLGIAISVERGATPADALQFAYDHPEFRSRLAVTTPTPLGQ